MREHRFTHIQSSATAQPLPPNLDRTEIPIRWSEEVGQTVKIRRHYVETARQVCRIKLNPGYRQEREAQFALAVAARMIYASRPERRVT